MSGRGVPVSRLFGRTFGWLGAAALVTIVWILVLAAPSEAVPGGGAKITDVNPDASTNANANASTGGRVNGLATDPTSNSIFYAASEYGGLFKTTDGGANWSHLDNHLPTVTWDIAVDPGNANRVYATSWYDGRVNSLAGIEVSTDGGTTWTRPASATPPANFGCAATRRAEPSAYGIGIRPDATNNVFVGTNCGVAISADSGTTWTFVDPTPGVSNCTDGSAACTVWDVVVQASGGANPIVDVCGDDGHYRSTDGGTTWVGGAAAIPSGRCSIAASPDESYVLFIVAADNLVYESDDSGATWTNLGSRNAQGRIPFVVTNQRANDNGGNDKFDLWYSDINLFLASCTTPAAPASGGANRCPLSGTWTNAQAGAHADAGDLEFDSQVAVDSCPLLYSTDGGAHTNTIAGSPGCHAPVWLRSNVGLHALWAWTMAGANQAGDGNEDLYFGTQDDGTLATQNAPNDPPVWTNPECCDTFDMLAAPTWVLGSNCCWSAGRFNRLKLANPGYVGAAFINTYPTGTIPGFTFGERLAGFGGNQVALITSTGLNVTTNITANPIVWTSLGAPAAGVATICNVQAAVAGGVPTFFVQAGDCGGSVGDSVFSYTGIIAGGAWVRIDNTDGLTGGFGTFGVDPNDPTRIYASNLAAGGPQVVFSTDGGTNWNVDPELDTFMTGGGVFQYQNSVGPTTRRGSAGAQFIGYVQPSLFAFDPEDSDIVVAGGIDSGVFLSTDSGANWSLLTDPINASSAPHIPRPRFAYFDHEPADVIHIYIGTQGRGVWRITMELPVADAGGPYATTVGLTVVLDGTGSSDPDGGALTYEWDFDDDGDFDDATGSTPAAPVGQVGLFPIALKVTDPGGSFDVDETTLKVQGLVEAEANGLITANIRHLDVDDLTENAAGNSNGVLTVFHDPDDARGSLHRACLNVWWLDTPFGDPDELAFEFEDSANIRWNINATAGSPTVNNKQAIPGRDNEPCIQWASAEGGDQAVSATWIPSDETIFWDNVAGSQPLIKEWNTIDSTKLVAASGVVGTNLTANTGELDNWIAAPATATPTAPRECVRDDGASATDVNCVDRTDANGSTVPVAGALMTAGTYQGYVFTTATRSFIDYTLGSHSNYTGPIDGASQTYTVRGTCGSVRVEEIGRAHV